MSLADEYPRSKELLDLSIEWMNTYLSSIGPDGEFNESPAYAASIMTPIRYYGALQCVDEKSRSILESTRLQQFGHWYAWHFLPPDRIVGFGDADREAPPNPIQVGAIAALFSDPVLQWFYKRYRHIRRYDDHPAELLSIDPTLGPVSPASRWPRAKMFRGYGAHAVSRSSWDDKDCIVYGKSAHGWEDARRNGDS